MPRLGQVDFLEQGCQRGRFSGAGRTTNQDQPVVMSNEPFQVWVQVEVVQRGLKGSEQPNGKTHSPGRVEDIDSAANALNGPGKIERASLHKLCPMFRSQHRATKIQQGFARNWLTHGAERASHTHGGRQSRLQMQVAGPLFPGHPDKRF